MPAPYPPPDIIDGVGGVAVRVVAHVPTVSRVDSPTVTRATSANRRRVIVIVIVLTAAPRARRPARPAPAGTAQRSAHPARTAGPGSPGGSPPDPMNDSGCRAAVRQPPTPRAR